MNLMDIMLLLLLGLGAYLGYKRGLFISLVRLCALLVGLAAGNLLWNHAQAWLLLLHIQTPPLSPLFLFIFVFVLTLLLFMLVAKGLKTIIYLTPFRFLDRGAGALFGMATWTILLGLLLWMTNTLKHTPIHKHFRTSTLAPMLQQSAENVVVWMFSSKHLEKITSTYEDDYLKYR